MSDFLSELFREDESVPFEKRERKEWVEKDPLTGGEQTVVTVGKSFMMVIPHQGIKLTPEQAENHRAIMKAYGERKWDGDTE